MKCLNCGKTLTDNAKFCKYCGNSVRIENYTKAVEKPVTVSGTRICKVCGSEIAPGNLFCVSCGEPVKKKNGKKKLLLTILIPTVLAIAVSAIVLVMYFNNKDPKLTKTENSKSNLDAKEKQTNMAGQQTESETDTESKKESETKKQKKKKESSKKETTIVETKVKETVTPESATTVTKESEYIIEGSDTRYITEDDLKKLDANQCRLARNELYARHGRKFNDENLNNYFSSKSWYHPSIEPDDFQESMLNEYEIANRDKIVEYENKLGKSESNNDVAMYKDLLDKYYLAEINDWDGNQLVENELFNKKMSYMYSEEKLGYGFYDCDGDSVDELIVGSFSENGILKTVFALYGIKNGIPVKLTSSGQYSCWTLYDNGAIGSTNFSYGYYDGFLDAFYSVDLENETVKHIEAVFTKESLSDDIHAYKDVMYEYSYSEVDGAAFEEFQPITEEQGKEILNKYKRIDLLMTSFENYQYVG